MSVVINPKDAPMRRQCISEKCTVPKGSVILPSGTVVDENEKMRLEWTPSDSPGEYQKVKISIRGELPYEVPVGSKVKVACVEEEEQSFSGSMWYLSRDKDGAYALIYYGEHPTRPEKRVSSRLLPWGDFWRMKPVSE